MTVGLIEQKIRELSDENDCDAYDVGCDKISTDDVLEVVAEFKKEIFEEFNRLERTGHQVPMLKNSIVR